MYYIYIYCLNQSDGKQNTHENINVTTSRRRNGFFNQGCHSILAHEVNTKNIQDFSFFQVVKLFNEGNFLKKIISYSLKIID